MNSLLNRLSPSRDRIRSFNATAPGLLAATALVFAAGCVHEQSFAVDPAGVALVNDPAAYATTDTRAWLRRTHRGLSHLLPPGHPAPLLTEDMVRPDGRPVDVFAHFGLRPDRIYSVWHNYSGLMQTVQGRGDEYAIDQPAPPWPGFTDIWVPVGNGLELSGRIGFAERDGAVMDADCIIILPGLSGDNSVQRTRDIAMALRQFGIHALALELRGHGQTEHRFPEVYYDFGVLETGDLVAVADWLQQQPHVRETGLIGYCWGGNLAMLAAWFDVTGGDLEIVPARLRSHLRPSDGRRHFQAGVMAFSPVLRFEDLIEDLHRPHAYLGQPPYNVLQETIKDRMIRKGYPHVSGDLRELIDEEFARSELNYPDAVDDGLNYLRLLPFRGRPSGDKVERIRVPLLVTYGANDPLCPAQSAADFIATVENPLVAGLILPGGGHVGFAAYARDYFYSLLINFFDPQRGPAAAANPPDLAGTIE